MNIVLTGSLGHIGKPLAEELVTKGHSVTVISSNTVRQREIEAIGVNPAIGSLEDVDFLVNTFTGAEIVYLMEPPANYFDTSIDVYAHRLSIADAYVKAIPLAGITKVVHLSSIGAHTAHGNGMLHIHHDVENMLKKLPHTVSLQEMRLLVSIIICWHLYLLSNHRGQLSKTTEATRKNLGFLLSISPVPLLKKSKALNFEAILIPFSFSQHLVHTAIEICERHRLW